MEMVFVLVYRMLLLLTFVFTNTFGMYSRFSLCQTFCECKVPVVVCSDTFPTDLPENTTEVLVYNPSEEIIEKELYSGLGWANVSSLSLIAVVGSQHTGNITLKEGAFEHLKQLTNLTIRDFLFLLEENIHPDAFNGTNQLKVLDMSGNVRLGFHAIISKLQTTMPLLEQLILRYVQSSSDGAVYVPISTFSAFKTKPIELIDFSGIRFALFELEGLSKVFPRLHTMILQNSNIYAFPGDVGVQFLPLPLSLRTLDLSRTRITYSNNPLNTMYINTDNLAHLTDLRFNNILSGEQRIHRSKIVLAGHKEKQLEVFEFMQNGLLWFNASLPRGTFKHLKQMNLAFNDMEYLSPNFLLGLDTVRVLNLSHNNLHIMQHYSDFNNLFRHNQRLHTLSLRSNGLAFIPRDMFMHCIELQIIDLSMNKLETVLLNLKNNIALRFLDLRNNLLTTVSVYSLNQLESIHSSVQNNVNQISVNVIQNPFSCSCNTKESIALMIKMKHLFLDFDKITCEMDGEITNLDKIVISDIVDLCNRQLKMALYCTGAAVTLLAILLIAFLIRRYYNKFRIKKKIQELLKDYKTGNPAKKYLVFLCYSSEDHEFIFEKVYDELEERLKKKLKTEKEVVCVGDMHFLAGRRIEDQIVEHIEASRVIILLISNSFCNSSWCDYETMVAYYDKKPLILMFKEEVERKRMPSVLSKLYRRYTRVVWKEFRGEQTICPGWDDLCDAIMEKSVM